MSLRANLVTNALGHTEAGTTVEVGCASARGEAVLTVRDHGPGLDQAALVHAFDRFWRGDAARVGAGTGLGLSIVAAIAAEHYGRVVADNPVSGGAELTFTVPLAAAAL